jgi:hypothetical protein
MEPSWTGPLLVAIDQDAADALKVPLAELRRVAGRVNVVAERSSDGAKLRRVVELLAVLDPPRAEAVRWSLLPALAQSHAKDRRRAERKRAARMA